MITKRLSLGLCLVSLLTGCVFGPISTPTGTPSPTLPPGVTPSGTPLPTFTPSPTPTAEVRVETGEQAFFNGDYDRALYEYQTALDTSTDPDVRAAALWGLGRAEYAVKNNGRALQTLRQLTSQYPASPNALRAYFLMGEIYMALTRYTEAAQAYTVYLALRPGVIDAYVQEQRGDAYAAAGNDAEAIAAYQVALTAPHIEDDTALQIKIARAYVSLGEPTTALGMYDTIFAASSNDYVKAQMDFLSGQIHLSLGQTDQATQRFLHTVDNYPLAYDSYSALVALVNAGVPTDDMNRGLVDYFAGQYGYALDAFQRYIEANPQNDGTALYYKALTLFALGQYEDAVQSWDVFIQDYPDNPHWAASWNGSISLPGRAFTQWYFLGQVDVAAQTLLTFVQQAPADANAPIYLVEAGRIQERDGKLEEAAQTWDRVADEYPGSELVPQALFWAGIARTRLGKYNDALVAFQRDSILSTNLEDQIRAHFWIGKAQQALGDPAAAQATWQQTAALDPTDYYSLRAQDMLFNRPAFDPLPAVNLTVNLTAERAEGEAWLRVTFNLPTDTDLNTPGALLADPRLMRGTEFWRLGLDAQARLEFDSLRTAVEQNPADCYRLANYLLDLGLYYPAIFAIRQVLTLGGMNTQSQTLAAPAYFNHVRYGLYYQELILPSAQQAGFDPLFLFSVMRQESLFDKFAHSSYAIGLMQITPDTGQFIVDNLGWPPNYTSEDLYRPMVSVGLGTSYLLTQRIRFNGDLFTALASYNAGPEAAPIWRDLSGPDPDLFVEVIRFEETRNYIRSIYEIYAMYRSLYTTVP
ncbi:MAG: tetratricopeptide repeat protein [Chloroflexi bacterium]|nr:tetratricopeptide repeat protein [Chloroflexota bacterium]